MIKKITLIIISYLVSTACFSQTDIYIASTLTSTLKEKAHSVKREEKINFEVEDIHKAKLSVHQVITVLDAEDEYLLFFQQYSDQFRKLENAEIKVFNAEGKQVNKYKMKEMNSQAIGSGLVEDGNVFYFRVAAPAYPVTVQYDYQIRFKGTLHYPDYEIIAPDQSVEHSIFTASVPASLDFKFKPKNISLNPVINNLGKNKLYTWEVKNLPSVPYEKGAVSYESSYPSILMAPNKFSMDGYEGDFTTWENFGRWYLRLSKGSINLSEETKSFLKDMVKNTANEKEKVKTLYNYLQKNFRYVSIQLGIGGYKTFDANFVDKKKYGDCKALSNYMQACLDAVGIKSYAALINAKYNKEAVDPDFPHNSFNHVILCVPGKSDTTWLECTSTTADFGVLGNFTENRNALLITPDGGFLVPTPKSKSSDNVSNITTKIILQENGSGESESILQSSGSYKEEMLHYILDEKKDDQKEYLVSQLGFLHPDKFELKAERNETSFNTSFKLFIDKIPEFSSGSKMFLNPRIYKIWNSKIAATEKRTKAYYFQSPFIKTDTTVYYLPENFSIENLPKSRNNQFEYGVFKTNYFYDDKTNTVTSVAFLELSQHIIPAEKFEEMKKFFLGVNEEYSEKIIIKRKQ